MSHTDPGSLPRDVRVKLLQIRAALLQNDMHEAQHLLYSIADPEFRSIEAWERLSDGITEVAPATTTEAMDALVYQINRLTHRPIKAWLGGVVLIGNLHCLGDESSGGLRYRCVEVINREGVVRDHLSGWHTEGEMVLALKVALEHTRDKYAQSRNREDG